MTPDSADSTPKLVPYLYYEDVAAAVQWLTNAFGFRERSEQTMRGQDGKVVHMAAELEGAVIMMGHPGPDYRSPKRVNHVAGSLYIHVSDVDAHFERAKLAGATFLSGLEDTAYGDRRYGAEDPEGHQWYFAQPRKQ